MVERSLPPLLSVHFVISGMKLVSRADFCGCDPAGNYYWRRQLWRAKLVNNTSAPGAIREAAAETGLYESEGGRCSNNT